MKDYTLSEIKAHCKARIAKYQNPCKGCEMEVVCKSTLPVGWDIEPRDMVDLPSVQKYEWVYPEASRNCVSYDVIYRDSYGEIQIVQDFDDEARAYAFLAEVKGGKG